MKISILLLYAVVDSALVFSLFLSFFFMPVTNTDVRTMHTKISILLLYVVVDSALVFSLFLSFFFMPVTHTDVRTTHTKISILLLYVVVDSALREPYSLSFSLSFFYACDTHGRTYDAHENLNPPIICCSRFSCIKLEILQKLLARRVYL